MIAIKSFCCFNKVPKEEPPSPRTKQARATKPGLDLYHSGQYEEAHEVFNRLISEDSSNLYAGALRARCLVKLGDLENAKTDATNILAFHTSQGYRRGLALYVLGEIYFKEKEYSLSRNFFQLSLENMPDFACAAAGIAKARFAMKQYNQALEDANLTLFLAAKETSCSPTEIWAAENQARRIKGLIYLYRGQTEKALDCFEKMTSSQKAKLIDRAISQVK